MTSVSPDNLNATGNLSVGPWKISKAEIWSFLTKEAEHFKKSASIVKFSHLPNWETQTHTDPSKSVMIDLTSVLDEF